jgi:acyl-CoA synthetase (AMP-forming)/AMP-acid ligase II
LKADGPPATDAEIIAYCKERMAEFKRPKQVHITTSIPRTGTGKISRKNVAESFSGAAR